MTSDDAIAVIDVIPESARQDVRTILLKFAPPAVVKAVLYDASITYELKNALLMVLFDLEQTALDYGEEGAARARWFANIMDFISDRIDAIGEGPSSLDSYDPTMPRPVDTDELLRTATLGPIPEISPLYWGGDSSRPPLSVVEGAKRCPNGQLFEIEGDLVPGVPLDEERVRGAWEIDAAGNPTGAFEPNPDYVPTPPPAEVPRG
jgi:hypothetical protein